MSVIDIFHAPRGFVFEDFETRGVLTDRGEVTLRYPVLTPETVQDLCETTRCNRSQTLAAYSVEHIVDIIGEAVELWTNPDYEGRQIAESLIPSITGYDATMTRIELKRYMRMFRRRELLRFLDDELPSPRMLDEYRPNKSGGYTRLYGPDLTFHVFSSNVPGIPVWSMTMSLLTKSAIIGKSSFDEPLMPVLFARSLTQINPDLADVLAIVPWRGGTVELEDVAIGEANAVIAYGSSHTTEAIRPRVSAGKPFLSYGARIGFSLIGREALRADTHVQTVHVWPWTWPPTTSKAAWRRKPSSWNAAEPSPPLRRRNCSPASSTRNNANIHDQPLPTRNPSPSAGHALKPRCKRCA